MHPLAVHVDYERVLRQAAETVRALIGFVLPGDARREVVVENDDRVLTFYRRVGLVKTVPHGVLAVVYASERGFLASGQVVYVFAH